MTLASFAWDWFLLGFFAGAGIMSLVIMIVILSGSKTQQ
jgi:hypothetical protein